MSQAENWTVRALLEWTASFFKKKGMETPRLEAEVLLASVLKTTRIDLYVRYDETPNDEQRAQYRNLVKRRSLGEPVAYLVGKKEFFALDFEVDARVLIPRPETEELVSLVLESIKKQANKKQAEAFSVGYDDVKSNDNKSEPTPINESSVSEDSEIIETTQRKLKTALSGKWNLCDVGTGSGCIAVSLAKNLRESQIVALDVSDEALEVASRNASKNGVEKQIEFYKSDLFDAVQGTLFHLIVSNPPYVAENEYAALEPTVRQYEPRLALLGGASGAELPLRLVAQAPDFLVSDGKIFIELSPTTVNLVATQMKKDSRWRDVAVLRDMSRLERFVVATRN